MNYLAHAYLSADKKEIFYGNFIGDFIKGRNNPGLPEGIWQGVLLHREIDHQTDNHPATMEAKSLVRDDLGLTSGIFIDMVFDHILAKTWSNHSEIKLVDFAQKTYQNIDLFQEYHPEQFDYMFAYMKRNNWLANYLYPEMMNRFINGLSGRLKVKNELKNSFQLFDQHEEELVHLFQILLVDLIRIQPK